MPEVRYIDNHDGWKLELRRYVNLDRLDRSRRPVLMVPGYAMNSFILGFHPGGLGIAQHLAQAGLEVWTVNLRGQGGARAQGAPARYGLAELTLVDLPAAIAAVGEHTHTEAESVDLIGCSLGGSLVFAYLAHHPEDHGVGAVVSMGGPLRWDKVHPVLKAAFTSGRLAGAVPVRRTRELARRVLPVAKRVPSLMSIYMNTSQVDLSAADQLVNTVDDPVPWINRQMARWIRDRDLIVRGINVSERLPDVKVPILTVVANQDGIVPAATALSVRDVLGSDQVDVLNVGDDERWYAHADLFIGRHAHDEVFTPIVTWLDRFASTGSLRR